MRRAFVAAVVMAAVGCGRQEHVDCGSACGGSPPDPDSQVTIALRQEFRDEMLCRCPMTRPAECATNPSNADACASASWSAAQETCRSTGGTPAGGGSDGETSWAICAYAQ